MRLTCSNDYADLRRVSLATESFLAGRSVPPPTRHAVTLVIEEAVSNVIRHGWDDGGTHVLDLEVSVMNGYVVLTVEDDGAPFDPTAASLPAPGADLESRAPGGMGLHLLRRTADHLAYRRAAGRNRLEIGLRIGPAA